MKSTEVTWFYIETKSTLSEFKRFTRCYLLETLYDFTRFYLVTKSTLYDFKRSY